MDDEQQQQPIADPARYAVTTHRSARGPVVGIEIVEVATGATLAIYDDPDEIDAFLARAADLDTADPWDRRMPADRTMIEQALLDLGYALIGAETGATLGAPWRDVLLRVVVNDGQHTDTTSAGRFCDDNQWPDGTNARIAALARGEEDEVRLGGGAAPLVVLTREYPQHDRLLAAARDLLEWDARMGGFDAPVWDALRAAVASAEGR